jgi:hypothetical protein
MSGCTYTHVEEQICVMSIANTLDLFLSLDLRPWLATKHLTPCYANKKGNIRRGISVQNKRLQPRKRLKHGGYPKLHSYAMFS